MVHDRAGREPSTLKLVTAFAAVYLVWGSTYLAIRFVVETLPPFIMAGARFLLAGTILYVWARYKGAVRPTFAHWRATALIGGLLLLGGNGGVVWAEKFVPSGLTALLVAMVPMWVVLVEWLRPRGVKPSLMTIAGLVLGFAGICILASPKEILGSGSVDPIGAGVLVIASLSWAIGSVRSKHVPLPSSGLLTTGMQMLCGGALLMVFGTIVGDWSQLHWAGVTVKSVLSLAYLVVFGSLIGFTAYMWLLKVTTPARVSTYAYVNPVVAVMLGWALGGESLNWRTILSAAVIVPAVVCITRGPSGAKQVAGSPKAATPVLESSSKNPPVPAECGC
jgi:drug/metabolite transporter (DMT)-like permease